MSKLKILSKLTLFTVMATAIGIIVILGSTLARAENYRVAQNPNSNILLGKELYIKNCSNCHVPLPAEVLPTESWEQILENLTNHYGQSLSQISRIDTRLIWSYLQVNSRPLLPGEPTPQYVTNSRYLKALHPQVELPKPATHKSCLVCHPRAKELDYRSLSSEWQ